MKDKVKGKVQEIKGIVTGDKTEELKGRARQKLDDVKESADELRRHAGHGESDPVGGEAPEDRDLMEPR